MTIFNAGASRAVSAGAFSATGRRRDLPGLLRRHPKAYRPILRACHEQGARWTPGAKNKTKVYSCAGGRPVVLHTTPSDNRSLRNDRAQLRRAGFILP